MPPPTLTLTTDFGLADHYAGVMKGVILGICPKARIVDISHEVTPYAIAEGGYLIAQSYRYFPRGTVHVVVVDPGVGSERRAIVAEAAGQMFVAPDNGVLSMVLAREKHRVRAIENDRYFFHPVSRTFHGRDIFAPVAAHLASGVRPARVGKTVADAVRAEFAAARASGKGTWRGTVLHVDRFGNIVTNFASEEFPVVSQVAVGRLTARRVVESYDEADSGEAVVIAGSSGYLEISIKQASAARKAGCRVGDACRIRV